jgi:uncharacterized protein
MVTTLTHSQIHLQRGAKIMANESSNQRGGSGNFANDTDKASEAGRKGAQQSQQGSGSRQPGQKSNDESSGGHRGSSGNFANDPERASEAGRKGGEHSHTGK